MDSLLKTLSNITNNSSVIFRPFLENGNIRRVYSSSGGDRHCFPSLRLAKAYMSRNYSKTYYWVSDINLMGELRSQKGSKYTIWAIHVGKDESEIPWFPPTLVYTHEPK